MDLESQDHILNYQLPVAIARYNVGLVVIDSITANYRAEHASDNVGALSVRSGELAKCGQMLRNLAIKNDVAIVVANQVSDRFDSFGGGGVGPGPGYSGSVWTMGNNNNGNHKAIRESGAAALMVPSTPDEGALPNGSLTAILPPSSSPATSSMPPSSPSPNLDEDSPFDGSYLVGNPVRNEILSLLHQQRFFTGWGDDPPPLPPPTRFPLSSGGALESSSPFSAPSSSATSVPPRLTDYRQNQQKSSSSLKTPALGFVWSTQIACRIALKKPEDNYHAYTQAPMSQEGQSGKHGKENEAWDGHTREEPKDSFGFKTRTELSIGDSDNDFDDDGNYEDNADDDDDYEINNDNHNYNENENDNDDDEKSVAANRNSKPYSRRRRRRKQQHQQQLLKRKMKLVFAPWTAGLMPTTTTTTTTVTSEPEAEVYKEKETAGQLEHVQDEVDFEIWEGGIRGMKEREDEVKRW